MTILVNPSEKIPNITDIIKFEDSIGGKLPKDYVDFIMKYGDGNPEKNGYPKYDNVYVRYFLSIFPKKKHRSIIRTKESINSMDESRIPSNFIPISEDDFGNFVLLDLNDGSIWFWDHEIDGAEPEDLNDKPYVRIAENFSYFFNNLVPLDVSKIPEPKIISVKVNPEFAKKFGIKLKPE
jgi:hypothetical protein